MILALESDIAALSIDTGPQSPWKGFNLVLNVLGVLHYFTALLHFYAVHSKPALPKVFILGLHNVRGNSNINIGQFFELPESLSNVMQP
jgi:hypothetical protein